MQLLKWTSIGWFVLILARCGEIHGADSNGVHLLGLVQIAERYGLPLAPKTAQLVLANTSRTTKTKTTSSPPSAPYYYVMITSQNFLNNTHNHLILINQFFFNHPVKAPSFYETLTNQIVSNKNKRTKTRLFQTKTDLSKATSYYPDRTV